MPRASFSAAPQVLLCLLLCTTPATNRATAATDVVASEVEALCTAAARAAAAATGVPEPVLRAISLTETGRVQRGALRPWPWTVNMEGAGKWFDTREEALEYVRSHHARGARSYDVGCFQINYRWHGNAFASVEDMFDPGRNALYAARFLARLYTETGSWPKSAAAYHSRTPAYANRYRTRFERILARITGGAPPPETPPLAAAAAPPPGAVPALADLPPVPLAVAGPLTVSPPALGVNGSLMPLDALPGGLSLLTRPPRPLF